MRLVSTGDRCRIAIIAATLPELTRLQRLATLKAFNENITTGPIKSLKYQCFVVVYTFPTLATANLFRLAYAIAHRGGKLKNITRVKARKFKRAPSYKLERKRNATRRRLRRQRKKSRERYFRLIPLLKAGKIATLEAKAREIARCKLIEDLL